MVKVSAIVPVYNVERYIADTVRSVLSQSFTDFELLIVDDASPDRSIEICQGFSDPRLRIVRQQNRGLAGARNTGIRHARGEYIALLDSDDLWLPDKLAQHVAHLDRAPLVGVSFSPSAFIDENGKPLGIAQTPQLTDITPDRVLCRNPVGNGSAPVIRRAVLDEIRFTDNLYGTEEDFYFDDRFRQSEDIECWVRIALQTNWLFEGIPTALTLYRVNSGGLSANMLKQYEAWERVIDKTRAYAPDFIAKWESTARAYQLRYLARRAIRNRDGKAAVDLCHRALRARWRILLEEPRRTLVTLLAAYTLAILPAPLYRWMESLALQVAARLRK